MTIKSLSAFGKAVLTPEWAQGLDRSMLVALVLTLAATLVTASTPRVPPLVRDASFEPTAVHATADAVSNPVMPTLLATPRGDSIDALAGVIAKKYRISQNATRDLIAAAYREGRRNGLDPLLIVAVMAVESRFNPIAESDMGAVGLMQVIPRYHEDKYDALKGESVLDPDINIQVGARVLKEYIRRSGSQAGGLQLYNGTPDDGSSAYANKVLGEKERLRHAIQRFHVQG